MEAELFFRVLYTPTHIHRWQQRRYTSDNASHGPPPAWLAAAAANQPSTNYPLATAGVVFLQTARDEFVQHPGAHGANALVAFDTQLDAIKERQLEIAGVSAYSDPIEAYWHGHVRPEPWQFLVSFYGFKVCDLGPEKDHGGVIAAVVKVVDFLTPNEFLAKFLGGVEPVSPHVVVPLPPEIAKVLDDNSSSFGKADEIRMLIPEVVARLNRLYASTVARRDANNQELERFKAEYKPNPVAESHGYDPIPQEVLLNEQTERVMFANIGVAIDAEKERFVIYICEEMGLPCRDKQGDANFGLACQSLAKKIGCDPRRLSGGTVHEQARVLANCFKHGSWKMDAEATAFLNGKVGDEIAFEDLDWPAMVAATGQVLYEIVKRLK